ncbi:MAG: hypothetical protein PHV68_04750 [Candidatus Gastranaerophilales bacterium]|nr:hypothetical protein [Candidatus Gastranaerophilales bacterium]
MEVLNKANMYNDFSNKILDMPFWVKEVIFIELQEKFEEILKGLSPELPERKNNIQLFVPEITYMGMQELETRERKLDLNIYKLLEGAKEKQSIIEITINNCWTLSETCAYIIEASHHELFKTIDSEVIKANLHYMSGKIRLGEYLVRIGKISLEHLEEALRTQKYLLQSTEEKVGIATILINANRVSEQDVNSVLQIKKESEKRFFLDQNISNSTTSTLDPEKEYKLERKIEKLTQENKLLKDQLRKLLNIEKN